MRKTIISLLLLSATCGYGATNQQQPISADTATTFTNPVLWADVPDPDVIRVGDTFYLMSTTMHLMPGAPVMRSKNLVNWELVSYLFDKLTDTSNYDLKNGTAYGRGQWATSIRYHNGKYYAYFHRTTNLTKGTFIQLPIPQENGSWYHVFPIFMMLLSFLTMMVGLIFFMALGN